MAVGGKSASHSPSREQPLLSSRQCGPNDAQSLNLSKVARNISFIQYSSDLNIGSNIFNSVKAKVNISMG